MDFCRGRRAALSEFVALDKFIIEMGAGGVWLVCWGQQCTKEVTFCPLGTAVLVFFFNWGEKKIKTVSTVGSLPLLSNVKSANTEVTMETGNRWANI